MNEPELDGLKPCPFCGRRSTTFRMERLSNMANAMKMDVNELVVKADE